MFYHGTNTAVVGTVITLDNIDLLLYEIAMRRILEETDNEGRQYYKEAKELPGLERAREQELNEQIQQSWVFITGEYHPTGKKQELRLLEKIHKVHLELTIGLEVYPTNYQPLLDSFNNGRMMLEELIESARYRPDYDEAMDRTFRPLIYREFLEYAQAHGLPVMALDRRGLTCEGRDKVMAHQIKKAARKRPVFALVGNLHAHPSHLPSYFSGEANGSVLTVLHDHEAAFPLTQGKMKERLYRSPTEAKVFVRSTQSPVQVLACHLKGYDTELTSQLAERSHLYGEFESFVDDLVGSEENLYCGLRGMLEGKSPEEAGAIEELIWNRQASFIAKKGRWYRDLFNDRQATLKPGVDYTQSFYDPSDGTLYLNARDYNKARILFDERATNKLLKNVA